jgi:2-phospho-L-lactate transferase/gluconeogenesis factor (CofD/UPF0052 family)
LKYTLIGQIFDDAISIQLSQFWTSILPLLALSNIWKNNKMTAELGKPQNIYVSKVSTEQNNVVKIIEYLKKI